MKPGWIFLLISIFFEVGWASSLRYTVGYTRLLPSIANAVLAIGGIITLAQAIKTIPTAIAYPVWTGISLIGVLIFNVFFLGETIGIWHFLFIALIVAGAIGLKTL